MIRKLSLVIGLTATLVTGCGPTYARFAPVTPVQAAAARADALDPAKFFAHAHVQAQAPGAFALQAESLPFLQEVERRVGPQRQALVKAIRADRALSRAIDRFPDLAWDEQLPVLRQVMALEARVMGFEAPPLKIEAGADKGGAFFDFDPERPGTGTVILRPESLAKDEVDPKFRTGG